MKSIRNKFTLATVAGIFLCLVLACGGGDPLPPKYHGSWTGSDGTTIVIEPDGKASFKSGGKSVDGGGAELDESAKTLKISLFGISQTWKIDREPEGEEMTLDGKVFRKR